MKANRTILLEAIGDWARYDICAERVESKELPIRPSYLCFTNSEVERLIICTEEYIQLDRAPLNLCSHYPEEHCTVYRRSPGFVSFLKTIKYNVTPSTTVQTTNNCSYLTRK